LVVCGAGFETGFNCGNFGAEAASDVVTCLMPDFLVRVDLTIGLVAIETAVVVDVIVVVVVVGLAACKIGE
jgi:hypothetical protein